MRRPIKGIWCHDLDLYICGNPIRMTAGEMSILSALLEAPDNFFSRTELIEALSASIYSKPSHKIRSIDCFIRRIRKKIRDATGYTKIILTEYNAGYSLNRYWYKDELKKRQAGP